MPKRSAFHEILGVEGKQEIGPARKRSVSRHRHHHRRISGDNGEHPLALAPGTRSPGRTGSAAECPRPRRSGRVADLYGHLLA